MPLLNKFEQDGSTLTPLRGEKPGAPLKGNGTIPVNNTSVSYTHLTLPTICSV